MFWTWFGLNVAYVCVLIGVGAVGEYVSIAVLVSGLMGEAVLLAFSGNGEGNAWRSVRLSFFTATLIAYSVFRLIPDTEFLLVLAIVAAVLPYVNIVIVIFDWIEDEKRGMSV